MKGIYVAFDLETTGLDTTKDRAVELAIIELDEDLNELRRFHTLIHPDCPIPESATAIHGITDEDVKDAPKFAQVASRVQTLIHDKRLIAYNTKYDIRILDRELKMAEQTGIPIEQALDAVDPFLIEKRVNSHKLSENYERRMGTTFDDTHRSMADTEATIAVLKHQLENDLAKLEVESLREINISMLQEALDPTPEGVEFLDSDRMFCRNENDNTIRFARGKNRGKACREEIGMLNWILGKDFPQDTKKIAGAIYEQYK